MEVEIDAIDSIDLNEQNFLSIFSGKSVGGDVNDST